MMAFHGVQWDFAAETLYYGVYYTQLGELIVKYSDQSASLVRRLKSTGDKSRLEILRAVKDGRVYTVPCDPYCWLSAPPSMNMILGVWWLGNLLYPEVYDYDMTAKAQEIYKVFWNYDLTAEEAAAMLG